MRLYSLHREADALLTFLCVRYHIIKSELSFEITKLVALCLSGQAYLVSRNFEKSKISKALKNSNFSHLIMIKLSIDHKLTEVFTHEIILLLDLINLK